ncbi:MAG: bifunctional UDP-N-acetylglucosamine diphosphorylase/glucosamine-1-phosphate N-acetyltransferase GlmU [bacterium]
MSVRRRGVVLAAGEGTRMKSSRPKVCHCCFGEPMLTHVLRSLARSSCEQQTVVVGAGREQVEKLLPQTVQSVEQKQQLGTGDALAAALEKTDISDETIVLVTCGDIPGVRPGTYEQIFRECETGADFVLLGCRVDEPHGYGRIVIDSAGGVKKIVEEKDATAGEKKINLINTGIMAAPAKNWNRYLPRLSNDNQAGEYYLTDVIELAVAEDKKVKLVETADSWEVSGINTRRRLVEFEKEGYRRRVKELLENGVTVHDPQNTRIGPWVKVEEDVEIEGDVKIFGESVIGEKTYISGPTAIIFSEIGPENTVIRSHINRAKFGRKVRVGPFCHVRPRTVVKDDVRLGNFVEIKKSEVGSGTNVAHLSYMGDTTLGSGVNVGAGTITCNYDGYEKHRTVIGDNVFVGSNCELIAPVKVEEGAIIAAGTTLTDEVEARSLAISRTKQTVHKNWVTEKWKPRKESENDQGE